MTRSELITKVKAHFPTLPRPQAEEIICKIFEDITQTLAEGGRVELRGFGTFSVRERKPRKGRNPRTGEELMVDQKKVPFFRSGKEVRHLLNS